MRLPGPCLLAFPSSSHPMKVRLETLFSVTQTCGLYCWLRTGSSHCYSEYTCGKVYRARICERPSVKSMGSGGGLVITHMNKESGSFHETEMLSALANTSKTWTVALARTVIRGPSKASVPALGWWGKCLKSLLFSLSKKLYVWVFCLHVSVTQLVCLRPTEAVNSPKTGVTDSCKHP